MSYACTHRRSRIAAIATAVALVAGPFHVDGAFAGGGHKGASAKAAKDASLTAEQIVDKMIDQDPLGYGGAEARVAMALVNDRGQENKRKVVMRSRKDGDTRRLFVRFQSPADVAGTSFLGIDDGGDRTQWLYLPAIGKTRRISGKQRNAAFVGTDYTYADMDNRDIDDSTKTRLADEQVGGRDCYVIEARPTSKESAYAKVMLWIAKDSWLPLRIRFFDGKDQELKRLTVQEVKKVDGRWVIAESKMVDLKRQHTTVMKVTEIDIRDDIPLEQFEERALERE